MRRLVDEDALLWRQRVVGREQFYRRKWRFYRRKAGGGALLWDGSCVGWWVRMRSCGGVDVQG